MTKINRCYNETLGIRLDSQIHRKVNLRGKQPGPIEAGFKVSVERYPIHPSDGDTIVNLEHKLEPQARLAFGCHGEATRHGDYVILAKPKPGRPSVPTTLSIKVHCRPEGILEQATVRTESEIKRQDRTYRGPQVSVTCQTHL